MATNVGGVWFSNDGGVTWQTSDLYGKPMYTVFASTASPGEFLAGGRYGLYKSIDSGESWNLLSLQSTFVLKAGEKYNNSDIIIAGYSSNVGVRRSIDGGLTWETVSLNSGFMKGFATTPANPEKMFLCGSSMSSSAFVSSDDGSSWQAIGPAGAGEGIYVSPLDEDFILLGHENGLYKTINGGTDWTLVLSSGSGRNVVEKDGVFYAAQYGGGLYESTDNGDTWTLNNNGVVDYYWQATGKSDVGVLFGMWGGIMRSNGFGDTHVMSHHGLDNAFTHALAYFRDTNELWAGTEGSGIYKSTDGGISWESKSNGLSTWWIYDFAPSDDIDYSAERLLVATYNGIFASDDNAENWNQVGLGGTQCSGVEIHPTNIDIFWAGASMPPIKYTENGGQTWQDCTGFPFALYPKLKIGKNNSGSDRIFIAFQQMGSTVYYADDGINFTAGADLSATYLPRLSVRHQATTGLPQMIYCATDTGVYKSSDAGENWTNAGFYQFCWSVQGSRNEEIYAGTDYGVYFSEDGSTWVAMNENISNQNIWNIVYGQTDDQLFCSTRGSGVYEYSHEVQYFLPPQNVQATWAGLLTWEPPDTSLYEISRELTGYNLYLDGSFQDFTTDLFYQYTTLIPGYQALAGVSAVYDDPGESIIVEVPIPFPPPQNLVIEVVNFNDVYIEWDWPDEAIGIRIYRDGVIIAEILDPNQTTYEDLALNSGVYEYGISALYEQGASSPIFAEVTIILVAPQNLSAVVQGMNNVFLTWDAPATRDLDYYNVYRNDVVIDNVTSTFYLDIGVAAGSYVYNVTAVYDGGWESGFSNDATTGNIGVGDTPLPLFTELNGNYPNPFNPKTTIMFALNEAGKVRIDVFNLKGQHVRTAVNEHLEAAYHSVVWDGKDASGVSVSSGVYFYKMEAGKYTSTKKMILMK